MNGSENLSDIKKIANFLEDSKDEIGWVALNIQNINTSVEKFNIDKKTGIETIIKTTWKEEILVNYGFVKETLESEKVKYDYLEAEGLTGKQLNFKYKIWKYFKGLLDEIRGKIKEGFDNISDLIEELKDVLRKVFEMADILLGSISKVVPGAGAIVEFKDTLACITLD